MTEPSAYATEPWTPPTPVDTDDLPDTRTSFRYADDGQTLELTLTLPAEVAHLLELLAEGADRAHESYSHGADGEAEVLFSELLLSPLSSLLDQVTRG